MWVLTDSGLRELSSQFQRRHSTRIDQPDKSQRVSPHPICWQGCSGIHSVPAALEFKGL